jgi:UDP-glucuronate 4-epimerase
VKYLVTGAAGFIGSHVSQALLLQGHQVVAVDSFNDYYSQDLKRARVSEILAPFHLSVVKANLEYESEVIELLNQHSFDSIIHLAAQPGVRLPLYDYQKYVTSNLVAYANLLINCRIRQVPNFLYASSSSVYGNCPDELFSEFRSSPSPVSFYGGTKLSNEILAKTGNQLSSTRTRGLRFFTVYGPWGRPDMAYFRLIASLLDDYRFQMYGDGSILRDFTFVDDVVNAILKLDKNLATAPPGFSDIVNIGGGNPFSLIKMVETIEEILKVKINSSLKISDPNDVSRTCADPSYLTELIGKQPQTNLRDGLETAITWSMQSNIISNLKKWSESVV